MTSPGAMTGPQGPAAQCTAASRVTQTTCTGSSWTTSPTAWTTSSWWNSWHRNDNLMKAQLHFSPLPSARTRWTGWGSVNTSRTRATRCGPRGRTWSSMSSKGVVRWEQTFRFGLIYRELKKEQTLLFFFRFLPWVLRNRLETSTTPMRWRRWEPTLTCWRAGHRTPSPPTGTVCPRARRSSIQR